MSTSVLNKYELKITVIHISERPESSSSTGPYSEDRMSAELGAVNPSGQLQTLMFVKQFEVSF